MKYYTLPYSTPPFRAVTGTQHILIQEFRGLLVRNVWIESDIEARSAVCPRARRAQELRRMRAAIRRAIADAHKDANLIACESRCCGTCHACAARAETRRRINPHKNI